MIGTNVIRAKFYALPHSTLLQLTMWLSVFHERAFHLAAVSVNVNLPHSLAIATSCHCALRSHTPYRTFVSAPQSAAMQHVSRFRCQQTSRAYSSAQPSGHALPQHPVQPSFRGARPCITHATPETADAGSSGEDQPVVRRRRLFRAGSGTSTTSSSSTGVGSNASTASRKRPASQGAEASQEDVLDSFAAAFESMAVSPKKVGANMPCF